MRAVRRSTLPLEATGQATLSVSLKAFAREKQHWLEVFAKRANRPFIKMHGVVRDQAVDDGYKSRYGLQSRHWKLALVEAAETWDRHYQAHFVALRTLIGHRQWSDEKRHYAFWVLSRYETYFSLMEGGLPKPSFTVDRKEKTAAANWLRRNSRSLLGSTPVVRLNRSLVLDAGCYTLEEVAGGQSLNVMTLEKGKRLKVGLKGHSNVRGTVRLVWDGRATDKVAIHVSMPLREPGKPQASAARLAGEEVSVGGKEPADDGTKCEGDAGGESKKSGSTPLEAPGQVTGKIAGQETEKVTEQVTEQATDRIEAIDVGYTEVFTTTSGKRFGEAFGATLTAVSDERDEKGRARNKLRSLQKKYSESSSPKLRARAKRMTRSNLGDLKWEAREARVQATIERTINQSLNELFLEMQESGKTTLVTEDLSHTFSFNLPKAWNRRLSSWTRGVLQKRIEFKAEVHGIKLQAVNPAYSSQGCPSCGFVDSKNRNGDTFTCRYCGKTEHADKVAAINLLSRATDPDITVYTPYLKVKEVLLKRFHNRHEAQNDLSPRATVPGRTSDTDPEISHGNLAREEHLAQHMSSIGESLNATGQSKSEMRGCHLV